MRTDAVEGGLPFSVSGSSLQAGVDGFDELDRPAELHAVGTVTVRVAALSDLIRSKPAAGRPKEAEALPELYRLAREGPGLQTSRTVSGAAAAGS